MIHMSILFSSGDIIRLGDTDIFRYNNPSEAEKLREKRRVNKIIIIIIKSHLGKYDMIFSIMNIYLICSLYNPFLHHIPTAVHFAVL